MSRHTSCGIDFGTTNSALAVETSGHVKLIPLENDKLTIPTAVFFDFEDWTVKFGRAAISDYTEGYSGRLLRSLKSILGSSLMSETTQIGRNRLEFSEIIGKFISHIKNTSQFKIGYELENVVVGRPVFFVDGDPIADANAEHQLKEIFIKQGFQDVSFEFEPVAAARDYEATLSSEELALIVDIGGGTSDFSIIRLSPNSRTKDDRTEDILANFGIHIGGTDFDKQFSLSTVMPEMGHGSEGTNGLPLPNSQFHALATWHEINSLYSRKNQNSIKELYNFSSRKELVSRLLSTVNNQKGHQLASLVEMTKISLSDKTKYNMNLDFIEKDWIISTSQKDLTDALTQQIEKIMKVAEDTVTKLAGLNTKDIKVVFMTGGSTGLPNFESHIRQNFPNAVIVHGDRFSSVAKGLGLSAIQRYGSLDAKL